MASLIYGLCALTACICAFLLLRAFAKVNYRFLLWSGLCFCGLALNNILLIVDKLVLPDVDLSLLRTGVALIAMLVLLYGLIWDLE